MRKSGDSKQILRIVSWNSCGAVVKKLNKALWIKKNLNPDVISLQESGSINKIRGFNVLEGKLVSNKTKKKTKDGKEKESTLSRVWVAMLINNKLKYKTILNDEYIQIVELELDKEIKYTIINVYARP